MNKGRNLKERIWAIVLAFAMVLGSVLPHAGLVAKAAEVEKTFRFQVTETLNAGQATETALELSGAKVVISGEGTEVCSGETDAKGTVELKGTFDDTKSYTYTVTKQGYKDVSPTTLDLSASEAVAVKMEMEDIQTSSNEVELNLDNESQKTATVKIADNHAISNQSTSEPGYTWKSNDTSIATVADGTITAVGRGKTDVTVSRNGKSKTIGVTVKEELNNMSISVVPGSVSGDQTTDVKFVKISVSGMESATGDVQIYKSGEKTPIGTIKASESNEAFITYGSEEPDAESLTGNIGFTAKYNAGIDDYYFNKVVSTDEITYKKSCQLLLKEISSKVTYGDTQDFKVPVDENTVQGRTLSYESDKPEVVSVDNSVDNKGAITINGQGTANITVTAAENDGYIGSAATFIITVSKKKVSILANQITWQQAKKTYDGNKDIELVGTVTSEKNNAVKAGDEIKIQAQAEVQVGNANVGTYDKATIVSVEAVNDNYEVTLDALTLAEGADLTGLDIAIEKRPLYIQVQKKDANSVTNIEYGKISAEIDKVIGMYEAAPAGTNGQIDKTKAEGVVTGEEETVKTMLSSKVTVVKNELADDAYVGTYKKALKPQWEASADTGNYALYFADEEQYYGSIHVVQESINNEDLWKKLSVKKSDGTNLYSNENGVFWVRKNDVLKFESTDTKYTNVKIALGGNQYDNTLTVGETDVTNGVYLVNEGDTEAPSTRTTSDATKADQDNQIPEGKIKVDNESPKVEFSTLATNVLKALVGDSFEFGNFVKFLIGDHEETITITDEKSGYTPDSQSYRILKLENDADATRTIKAAALTGEEWQALPETGKVTVPAAESGYYVVLVKVVDNVGNEAVYASNGVVVDLDKPSVSLDITTEASEYGEYAGDVAYTIHVTDPVTAVASGISEIQVTVTNAGEEVTGDAASYTNTYTLDNVALNQLKGLDGDKDAYTLEELAAKAEYTINGTIMAEGCNSNNIKIIVTAFDQAGNEVTEPIERNLRIDTTKPEILPITYDVTNETGCYKERTMTIQYKERNFDPELAKFIIKENDNKIETTLAALMSDAGKVEGITVAKVTDLGESKPEEAPSDESIAAYTLKFGPQDGKDITYSVVPSISDKAGNTNETPMEEQIFTIDNVLPVINVSYDNNDVQNEKYFKAQRVMTLTCTERNFDESKLNFIVDGNEEAPVTINALKAMDGISGVTEPTEVPADNKYVYTITFGEDKEDFDFNIVPKVTDKAGNVNSSVKYAEGTKAEKEFTVDMVEPVMEVKYQFVDKIDGEDYVAGDNISINPEERIYGNKAIQAVVQIEERNFKTGNLEDSKESSVNADVVEKAVDVGEDEITDIINTQTKTHTDEAALGKNWELIDGKYTKIFKFEDSANYEFNMTYTDLAGNSVIMSKSNYLFTVDKEAPTVTIREVSDQQGLWEGLLERIFRFFSNEPESIKYTAVMSDNISPITGEYNKKPSEQDEEGKIKPLNEEELKGLSWTLFDPYKDKKGDKQWVTSKESKECSLSVAENEAIVPYVKVADKAGNITYVNADGAVCEKIPSTIEITGLKDEEHPLYNGDVMFGIEIHEKHEDEAGEVYSGLNSVQYRVLCDEKVPEKGGIDVTVTALADEENDGLFASKSYIVDESFASKYRKASYIVEGIKIPKDPKDLKDYYNSNNVKIEVSVMDNAGNKKTEYRSLGIDTTLPTATYFYDNNKCNAVGEDNYFAENRIMTIEYNERNFNPEKATFKIKVDGKEYETNLSALLSDQKLKNMGVELVSKEDSQSQWKRNEFTDDRKIKYQISFGKDGEEHEYELSGMGIVDEVGNVGTVGYDSQKVVAPTSFTIDRKDPEIEISYDLKDKDATNVKYFKNVRTMTVSYTEKYFDEEKVSLTLKSNTTKNLKDWMSAEEEGIEVKPLKVENNMHTYQVIFGGDNLDIDFDVETSMVDLAGNENKSINYAQDCLNTKKKFTVDKVLPVIDVEYMAGNGKIEPGKKEKERIYESVPQITANVKITERNFSANADNSFSNDSEQMTLEYTAIDNEKKPVATVKYTNLAKEKWNADGDIKTKTFAFDEDANYTFALDYTDLAGNKAETHVTRYFTKDEKAPEGTITIPNSNISTGNDWSSGIDTEKEGIWEKLCGIVYNFFTNADHKSTIEGEDETAGVDKIYYYIDKTVTANKVGKAYLSEAELNKIAKWEEYKDGITVQPNSQSAIYAKIVDKAGNITYLNAEYGIIADNKKPSVSLTDLSPTINGFHSNDVMVEVQVEDPKEDGVYAGIWKVEYKIESTTNKVASESGTVAMIYKNSSKERNWSGTGQIKVNAKKFDSNDVEVKVTAYDSAGNTYTDTISLQIDTQPPVIEKIEFIDNYSPSNGTFYNGTKRAQITVRERNFDRNQIHLNIDGSGYIVGTWNISEIAAGKDDNNVNTCIVEFPSDGDYEMDIWCTDLAGNDSNTEKLSRFTVDKTAPTINVTFDNNSALNGKYYNAARTATITINEHNFQGSDVRTAISSNTVTPGVRGWSMGSDIHTATVPFTADGNYSFNVNYTDMAGNPAQVYTVNEFVIDQTKPVVEIFDILDKSANNDVVAPGVRYSDTNHDVNGVSITYKGAEHSEKAVDGTRSNIPNGESIKMADFEHTPETDDVYTMVAKVTDLAGNFDEKQVTFSVNRFGSNFIFRDATEEFLDGYYNKEEEDLVVTEINVDTLTHRGISCGRDGELTDYVEGTDYTVKESGSEVSWKSYEYTINKENFEKEGLYNITIDSVDRATNEVNNKIKEADIEFVIDKTAPSVVITGIEDNGQYRTNERDVTIAATDNVVMDQVAVYVNDSKKPVESFDSKEIQEQKGELIYELESSSDWQDIKVVAKDAAGNITDTSVKEGGEEGKWMRVLVTSNVLVQYYRNTPLFIGSLVGLAAIAFLIIFLIAKRRKDKEEAQN